MVDDLYLAHHGIKGMKWGVRRYQNEDGSWTEEGKARYGHWKGPNTARYHRLNKKADRGDRLRAEGKTITGNSGRYGMLAVAAIGTYAAMSMEGKNAYVRYKDRPIANVNPTTIQIGTALLLAGMGTHKTRQNAAIRASYMRDRYGKDKRWAG